MRDYWFRLGSPHAISVFSFAYVVILQTAGSLLSAGVDYSGRLGPFLGVRLFALLPLGLVLWAGKWALRRWAVETPHPLLTLATFAVAISVGTATFDALLLVFDFTETSRFLQRLMVVTPGVFTGLVLVGILVTSAREHADHSRTLDTTLRNLVDIRQQAESRIRAYRFDLASRIRKEIDHHATQVMGSGVNTVSSIRTLIDDVVRPLSYRLASGDAVVSEHSEVLTNTRVDWRDVIFASVRRNPFHPRTTSVVIAAVVMTFLIFRFGLLGLLGTVALTGTIWLVVILANRLWRLVPRSWGSIARSVLITSVFVIAALLAAHMIQTLTGLVFFAPVPLTAWLVLVCTASWATVLTFSVFALLQETNSQLEAAVADYRAENATINTAIRQFNKAASRVLHGPIQEAVQSALRRIESIEDASRHDVFLEDMKHRIGEALTLFDHPIATHRDPETLIRDLKELWGREIDISIAVGKSTQTVIMSHPDTCYAVSEVVREACQNAIRHGHATAIHVTIRLTKDPAGVKIRVDSTGKKLPEHPTHGLGSSLFDDVSVSWRRTSTPYGVRVDLVLPLITPHRP